MNVFVRIVVIALFGLLAMQAHAQYFYGPGQAFVCKSTGYRPNYCEADTRAGVRIVQQLSSSICIQGQTWGFDQRGVWVAQGCEAQFKLGGHTAPRIVHCESRDYRQSYCPVDARGGVSLQRQNSSSACIRGHTWGSDPAGIWVSDGCKGDFLVGGGWDRSGPPPLSVLVPGRLVRCESLNGRTARCDLDTRGGVSLAAQISGSACSEGQTWGWDRNGIWVSSGCRADFKVGSYYR
jgi:hypothetical protein